MKRIILLSLFVVMCLAGSGAWASEAKPPIRLGIMKFVSRTNDVSEDKAAAIGDVLARMLTNSKTILVLERDQIAQVEKELHDSMSPMFSPAYAAQIGKIIGCQYMLLGAVTDYKTSGSHVNVLIVGTHKYNASATIDIRVVNVETTEVVMSLSETGMASSTERSFEFYSLISNKFNFSKLETGAISDATSRISYKIRYSLTGEHSSVIKAGKGEITLNFGELSGARPGGLYTVFTDGEEMFDTDGTSLGRDMRDIAAVRIVEVQPNFSTAEIAGKGAGNLSLVRKGDKIYPISPQELQTKIKRKVFPKARPKEVKLDKDLEEFLRR